MAALRHFQVLANSANQAPSFHSPHMAVLLQSIIRYQSQQDPKSIRLPITASLMHHIKLVLSQESSTYHNNLIWAAYCIGFFGFLRCGEFLVPDRSVFDPNTHLLLRDVSFGSSGKVWSFVLTIKASKIDQFRKGAHFVLGATSSDLCPVAALFNYLAHRGRTPGPLFQLEDGKPLKHRTFATSVQQALTSSGLDGRQINGDSFQIGAAITASALV